MEKTVVILMGIQASGKSTFYKKYLSEDYDRVNLDTLGTRSREKKLIEKCFLEEKSFAVDNTNPAKADRARYIPAAKQAGYKVIGYFLESKIDPCIERNNRRRGKAKVPLIAILGTSNKLEMPSYAEGFDELYFVANDGKNMKIEKWRE